jgi:hypothetical protein
MATRDEVYFGTSFPTFDLTDGTKCYRTDEDIMYVYDSTDATPGWKPIGGIRKDIAFVVEGNVSVGSINTNFPVDGELVITEVYIYANTAPTGADLIVDVNKNGTTIFTTQGNRPQIAAGANADTSGTPDVTSLLKNNRLTIDIDQVGSTIAGADLTVVIRCKQKAN